MAYRSADNWEGWISGNCTSGTCSGSNPCIYREETSHSSSGISWQPPDTCTFRTPNSIPYIYSGRWSDAYSRRLDYKWCSVAPWYIRCCRWIYFRIYLCTINNDGNAPQSSPGWYPADCSRRIFPLCNRSMQQCGSRWSNTGSNVLCKG